MSEHEHQKSAKKPEHKSLWYMIIHDYRFTLGALVVIACFCIALWIKNNPETVQALWESIVKAAEEIFVFCLAIMFIWAGLKAMFGPKGKGGH